MWKFANRWKMAFWLIFNLVTPAFAHEVRPAYLRITINRDRSYQVLWKQPLMGVSSLELTPHLSGGMLESAPSKTFVTSSFQIRTWKGSLGSNAEIDGQVITIEGLKDTITNVFVDITLSNGNRVQEILTPEHPAFALPRTGTRSRSLLAYLKLGIEHILTGIDHLMFVLGLILLVTAPLRRLLYAITAFTVAHSLTLAATALGIVHVQPPLVESLVALSIMFLAVEVARAYQGHYGLTYQHPWLVAFIFGLLHGFAFAGALANLGLESHDIPMALGPFNLGVEIGQLLFVAAILGFGQIMRRLPRAIPAWSRWIPPYAIGSCAVFWFIASFAAGIS
jgi:hydrogenase/urease accessory protein HupE